MDPKEIIVFGGSFNPPHCGHLHLIEHTLKKNPQAILTLVVARISPFKQSRPPIAGSHRIEMLEILLSILDKHIIDRIIISDLELKQKGVSYSIHTLNQIKQSHPEAQVSLLIGSDHIATFHKWHLAKEIINNYKLLIYRRRGTEQDSFDSSLIHSIDNTNAIRHIYNPLIDCSSSLIRQRIQKKPHTSASPFPDCLPQAVWDYIKRECPSYF